MSPEQFLGQHIDGRSDLFSVGVILYQLLTGERPFEGKTVAAIMHRVLSATVDDPSHFNVHLPESFDPFMRKALAKRPQERFQTAEAFSEALSVVADGGNLAVAAPDEDATLVADVDATNLSSGRIAAASGPAIPIPEAKGKAGLWTVAGFGVMLLAGLLWWYFAPAPTPDKGVETPAATTSGTPATGSGSGSPDLVQSSNSESSLLKTGSVSVYSDPPGASVWQGTKKLGSTPLRVDLSVGTHHLLLRTQGYEDLEVGVEVSAGAEVDIDLPLIPR